MSSDAVDQEDSMFRMLMRAIARLFRTGPSSGDVPPDPYSYVRQPRRGGPRGRSAGVALVEPDPDDIIHAAAGDDQQHVR